MAITSSSPVNDQHSYRSTFFRDHPVLVPSSPAVYMNGEISPSLDASFQSSMSLSAETIDGPSPLAIPKKNHFALAASPYPMDISPAPLRAPLPPRPAMLHVASSECSSITSTTSSETNSTISSSFLSISRPETERSNSRSNSSSSSTKTASSFPFLNLFRSTSSLSSSSSTSSITSASRSTSPETFLNPLLNLQSSATRYESRRLSPGLELEEIAGQWTTVTGRCQPQIAFSANARGSSGEGESSDVEAEELEGEMRPPSSVRRSTLPTAWSKIRHTAPAGELFPPPMPPVKRLSEPVIPTFRSIVNSSPAGMDLDQNSPQSTSSTRTYSQSVTGSGASDRLADCFASDLSPVPLSRKRFFQSDLSPTPISPSPPSNISCFNMTMVTQPLAVTSRRTFEKSLTISSFASSSMMMNNNNSSTSTTNSIRRRPSTNSLSTTSAITKRPGLTSFTSTSVLLGHSTSQSLIDESSTFKRQAQVFNGKPAASKIRRAYSVAGVLPTAAALTSRDPNIPDSYRASTTSEGFFNFANSKTNSIGGHHSIDIGMMDGNAKRKQEEGSPLTGFRTQEGKGKSLPCFGVKEDGLMRISSATLEGLQRGEFAEGIKSYLVIDCRFSYEFEGGHINEAVNLPTTVEVEQALLDLARVPKPSTSENSPADGKTVLIFHCEFSAKRAPTSGKHLRSKDRLLNIAAYPKIHYPEVYILQGGYADFYKNFPDSCTGGYLSMDDPEHNAKRAVDLHAFRQQKRQFSRASSFTFGQAQSASAMLQAVVSRPPLARQQLERTQSLAPSGFVFPAADRVRAGRMAIEEEEHDPDSSFGTHSGSSPGVGDSPCPTSKQGKHSFNKIGKELFGGGNSNRRVLERAQTSSISMFKR